MLRRLSKGVAFLLTVGMLLQTSRVVYAAPSNYTVSSLSTYQSSAEERVLYLLEVDTASTGQYGLFVRLSGILQCVSFLDFLQSNYEAFGLQRTSSQKGYSGVYENYFKRLSEVTDEFNEDFSQSSEKYKSIKLKSPTDTSYKTLRSSYADTVGKYLKGYLDNIASEGLNSQGLKEKYGSELAALYQLLDDVSTDTAMIGNWASSNQYNGSVLKAKVANSLNKVITGIVKNPDYVKLFDVGEVLSKAIGELSVGVDTSVTFIENLADVAFGADGALEVAVEPRLKLAYLACFASSAVYTPFVSYVGNTEFMNALSSLADKDVVDDLKLLYNSTKTLKKPLYKRELDSTGAPTGVATIITLDQLVEDIQNGNTGALCTILGVLDSDTEWVYQQHTNYSPNQDSQVTSPYTGEITQNTINQAVDNTSVNNGGQESSEDSEDGSEDSEDEEVGGVESPLSFMDLFVAGEAYADSSDGTSSAGGMSNGDSGEGAGVYSGFAVQDSDAVEIGTSGGTDVFATEKVTDESAMSDPVLLYGAKYSRSYDNMSTILLTNILASIDNLGAIDSKGYLFMNAYGDIVLSNDLVILPGSANPLYYRDGCYNPFTVAFMNSYPSVLKNTSYFTVASKSDIGKYLVLGNYDPEQSAITDFRAIKIVSRETISSSAPLAFSEIERKFYSNNGVDSVKVFKTRRLIFDYKQDEGSEFESYAPLLNSASIMINGNSVFPYAVSEDTSGLIAKAIAQNVFTNLAIDQTTCEMGNQAKLNDAYLLDAIIINGLNGTNNASGYQNSLLMEYAEYTQNAADRRYTTLKEVSRDIVDRIGNVSGVIGVKSIYSNKAAAALLNVFRENWVIFILLILIIVLFFFSKSKMSLPQCVVYVGFYVVCIYVYVTILPSFLPSFFNLVTNNLAQTTSYQILSLSSEHSSYDEMARALDKDGYLNYTATSLNLYKVSGTKRTEFLNSLNVKPSDISGGNISLINPEAGIYAKDDAICVDVNSLFNTLKITGESESGYAYVLSAKKTVSSNVDYYVPYYEFVDHLIEKVNGIAEIYSIPRHTSVYANGRAKNNYLLYSYVNSKPFITPGEYDYVIPMSELDWSEEEVAAYVGEGSQVKEQLTEVYGNNSDWLGIADIFYNLSENDKKTLWAQTMQDNGFYDLEWNPNVGEIDELITYVNYQTRKFVLDMTDEIGSLSDDIMIKVVSLRALIAFTQHVSDFGHWLYPFTINYSEMALSDVVQSAVVSDYKRYISCDMDVVEYVFQKHGWVNLIAFDVMLILEFIVVSLLNWVIPLAYLAFAGVLIYRTISGKGIREPFLGCLKVMLIILACSTCQTLGILGARAISESTMSIYLLLGIHLFDLFVLGNMVLSVVRNFTEFGNTTLSVKLDSIVGGLHSTRNRLSSRTVRTNNLSYNRARHGYRRDGYGYGGGGYGYGYGCGDRRYRLDSRVDDVYNSRYYGGRRTRRVETEASEPATRRVQESQQETVVTDFEVADVDLTTVDDGDLTELE